MDFQTARFERLLTSSRTPNRPLPPRLLVADADVTVTGAFFHPFCLSPFCPRPFQVQGAERRAEGSRPGARRVFYGTQSPNGWIIKTT